MSTLIFFLSVIAFVVLLIRLMVKARSRKKTGRAIIILLASYSAVWLVCYFIAGYRTVPVGTDVCFDDWCATVTSVSGDSTHVVLHLRMSNHARGIAQKPSEPRVHIIDEQGHYYTGTQQGGVPLDAKLQLGQSLETTLVFAVPQKGKLTALIEEGPFITYFLFPESQDVFVIR